jgi:predicted phage-related endonuclease
MKSISQIFKGNEHLMDLQPVEELIDYCQDLEEKVIETNLEENKEHIYKSIIQDILISCNELEESKLLAERYPDLYKKTDAETLVHNLKNYILDMNRINKLNL